MDPAFLEAPLDNRVSIFLMVTACSFSDSVQEPSHGAGHTRPVNSGKLFVRSRRLSASCHSPR